MTSTTGTTSMTNSPSSSREASPAPLLNILAPRARRYSASYASLGVGINGNGTTNNNNGPRLTPRVSQLRQEECLDMNSREMNHERENLSALQISQSWEDLTLVAENWSCKSDELSNPLQVALPSGPLSCSSPSPTSGRSALRLPCVLSPSPTRRTFATRRSMSPIAMRPSQLGPVKRKFFEIEENSNWNTYSPPPFKKVITDSRGPSPICQSPSSVCPSPDSGTYEGRITPKLFLPKLCSNSTNTNSLCSSPSMVPSPLTDSCIDLQSNMSSSSSPANTVSSTSSQEIISIGSIINNTPKIESKNETIASTTENMGDDDHEMTSVIEIIGNSESEFIKKMADSDNQIDISIEMKVNNKILSLSQSSSISSSLSFDECDGGGVEGDTQEQVKMTKTESSFSINNDNSSSVLLNNLNKGNENIPQVYDIEYQQKQPQQQLQQGIVKE